MKPRNKGFTLIELVLTVVILSLVMMIVFSIFLMASKPHEIVQKEFVLQSNVRLASQKLSTLIKKSTAIFAYKDVHPIFKEDIYPEGSLITIDESFINSHSKKSDLLEGIEKYKGWSFITTNENGTEVREFVFHSSPTGDDYYTMSRILEKQSLGSSDIVYEISYKKNNPYYEDNLLEYFITGKSGEGSIIPISISSEVQALSSMQVVDKGDVTNKAEVLFYRTDERPMGSDVEAAVAMVLDISGSMGDNMDGGSSSSSKPSRISILRDKATDLVNKMSSLDNVYINLIPFSNTSNRPSAWSSYASRQPEAWKNANTKNDDLVFLISKLVSTNGTNVGDGIRRAYYRLNDFSNKDANKYIILLMDGVPTFGSVHKVSIQDYTFKRSKNGYSPPSTLEHNGHEYFFFESSDNYTGFIIRTYVDTTYTYRRYSEINFVTNTISIKDTKLSSYNTQYNDGRYFGPGNESDEFFSKGYIKEISKKLADIKNTEGVKNLKVFVIGFSNVTSEKAELEFIKNELNKYATEVTSYDVSDAEGLATVFLGINQIILDDLWAITGPKE